MRRADSRLLAGLVALVSTVVVHAAHADILDDVKKALTQPPKAGQQSRPAPPTKATHPGQPSASTTDSSVEQPRAYPEAEMTAQGADVVGIRLGMTLDEVRAILGARGDFKEDKTQIGVSYQMSPNLLSADHYFTTLRRAENQNRDNIEVQFSPSPGQQSALFVQRTIGFARDSTLHENIKSNVLEKYGKYGNPLGDANPPNGKLLWLFGEKIAVTASALSPLDSCSGGMTPLILLGSEQDASGTVKMQNGTLARCGPSALKVTFSAPGKIYISSLTATLMSRAMQAKVAYDHLVLARETVQKLEQEKLLKAKSATKPDL
jgi:hypothetical protein